MAVSNNVFEAIETPYALFYSEDVFEKYVILSELMPKA